MKRILLFFLEEKENSPPFSNYQKHKFRIKAASNLNIP
ncbi:MAG: hypothetical protein ACJAT4_002419 [Granulosicoccus sp.]|jgi:hypothetical protein